jgi:Nucleotidyltransferase of unknown function (DUF6036)
MSLDEVPEPWRGFLKELDELVAAQPAFGDGPVDLHCTGGFVVTMLYGFERTTNDLDIIEVVPADLIGPILKLADKDSALAAKHKVYIDAHARVADLPCDYRDRLIQMYPDAFTHLRLFAPDPYDLALSKLERNADRDVEDVKHLAVRAELDPARLRERYLNELRPYLVGRIEKHDLTLKLWVEMLEELSEHD